jgi:tetratricopeptide (TPR) repeat protein
MGNKAIIIEADFMTTKERALADALFSEGRFDEARRLLTKTAFALLSDEVDELLACRNLLAKVERGAGNFYEALKIHIETYPLSKLSRYHGLQAKFHNGLGNTYEAIANKEELRDYFDRALIEYEAARFHLEEAGALEECGYLENNIAAVLSRLGRTEEAHAHLEEARKLFRETPVNFAQVEHTTAQVYLEEDKAAEALACALDASRVFLRHGEKRLLDDSIRTLLKAAADYQASAT